MFERYTERARRALFFARYEASQFGSSTIESDHFLLGLLREGEKELQDFIPTSIEAIRGQIRSQAPTHGKTSTSKDIPLSDECKRILVGAAEESRSLGHPHIDTSHLLLGVLRENTCIAAKILLKNGLFESSAIREAIQRTPLPPAGNSRWAIVAGNTLPTAGVVPDEDTAKRIAEAVWIPRTSASPGDQIAAQNATLTYGVWLVTGSHSSDKLISALTAFIQKEDGKILRLHVEKPGA